MNLFPVRKVLVGGVASVLLYVARKHGVVDFGSADANQWAQVLVGTAAAYAVKDGAIGALFVGSKADAPVTPAA